MALHKGRLREDAVFRDFLCFFGEAGRQLHFQRLAGQH